LQKIIIGFVIFIFILTLKFASSRTVESILQPQSQVERQQEHANSTPAD